MEYRKLFTFGELFCSKTIAINSSLWDIVAGEASEFIHFMACIVVQGIKKVFFFSDAWNTLNMTWSAGEGTLSQPGYSPGMWKRRKTAKTEREFFYDLYDIPQLCSYNGYTLNSHLTCFQRGFIAQLVEHRTGIAEVMGSNPVGHEAPGFFLGFLCNCFSCFIYNCEDHFHLHSLPTMHYKLSIPYKSYLILYLNTSTTISQNSRETVERPKMEWPMIKRNIPQKSSSWLPFLPSFSLSSLSGPFPCSLLSLHLSIPPSWFASWH